MIRPDLKFLHDAFVLAEVVDHLAVDQVRLAAPADQWPDGYVRAERGGHVTAMTATAANALGVDLAHVFRGVFAFGVLCLIASLVALIRMEKRPLRGRN